MQQVASELHCVNFIEGHALKSRLVILHEFTLIYIWNEITGTFFEGLLNYSLISTPGTRFPRAVREPPRRLPAGSPLDTFFPQESRTLRSNQLERFLK